ncbi:MAG: bifunctional folylpolyglutamate synthase/dihydrofolate synthase [Deltaproteobacteria bacterium]|nr:bifunctional folylpolyglutamate synthase/dihydrofolate synthase [Deltaproteobacteria bacterium]MBW2519976.1 bifunctional folylpolyglutamate synthase/dihydrofolate synthase [Deltaproteobacteria bacterium]
MTFKESLDYLYGLQRFGIKLGLDNMQRLTKRLSALNKPLLCAHVAGTNGKGSVSALLAEILIQSGLNVGLYTSPHLHCFTERITVNSKPIPKCHVAQLVKSIRTQSEGVPLTFFEATTCLALLYFEQQSVDFAIIETGMGGRLDATNVVNPGICLITPVSLDHQEHLGNSLSKIAHEKAGIIKQNVPVVLGRQSVDVLVELEKVASERHAPVIRFNQDYHVKSECGKVSVEFLGEVVDNLTLALEGVHQTENLGQAVAAALKLREQGLPITQTAIRVAAKSAHWPARLEWWQHKRQILLDVAHNEAGFLSLANYLNDQGISKVSMVIALSGKRSPMEVLPPIKSLLGKMYAVPLSGQEHVPTASLALWASQQGIDHIECTEPVEALRSAMMDLPPNEVLVICGSIYLVSEIREFLRNNGR